ncbi:F-box domain-containing protein [Pleurotus pulmonarius]
MGYKSFDCTFMRRLPPEIQHLIIQELQGNHDWLRNCSLVCKSWHKFCLPVLFRELVVVVDDLRVYSSFLTNSPHLCPYIRKVTIECGGPLDNSDIPEDLILKSILLGFPHLDELLCSSVLFATLSPILPQFFITKLYLEENLYSPCDLLPILEAVAPTVRSLTLQDFDFGDEVTDFGIKDGSGPICMPALEELALVFCGDLPLSSKFIRMPNLKTLYCAGKDVAIGDNTPSSLNTLVVADVDVGDDFKPFVVCNICIRWCDTDTHDLFGAVEYAIKTFTIPSKIKHIEILPTYLSTLYSDRVELDRLEAYVLDLRRSGSFDRLTFSVAEESNLGNESIDDRMPNLSNIGLLDIRIGRPSVLYPRCTMTSEDWDVLDVCNCATLGCRVLFFLE